ncbi:hypothetical protein HCN44_004017 [Aphidius gifuensis]|uniref:Ras-associating domain-containing protein n=1 Tax=Aphidius gifuensis TaxID=684658 RepID=A0A834XW51_APHGI|nr:ras association domain-containing protein 8 [Aphidius gifuensis]KAF7994545.1 hypothetical protein HCN44_004017 [Aphidius gifuensis]
MELKVWVEGIQRIVCGVTETTTCQDVVYALAHATAQSGRFTLVERWRNNERFLAPFENPVTILMKWGEYASDVQLILRRSNTEQINNKNQIISNTRNIHGNSPSNGAIQGGSMLEQCAINKGNDNNNINKNSTSDYKHQTESPKLLERNRDIRKSLTFSGLHGVNTTDVNNTDLQMENIAVVQPTMQNKNKDNHSRRVLQKKIDSPTRGSPSTSDGNNGRNNIQDKMRKVPPYREPPGLETSPIRTLPPYRDPPPPIVTSPNGQRDIINYGHIKDEQLKTKRNLIKELQDTTTKCEQTTLITTQPVKSSTPPTTATPAMTTATMGLPGQTNQSQNGMVTVAYTQRYADLIRLVNRQRDTINSQQVDLTKFDAEIIYWENKNRENLKQMGYISQEVNKIETDCRITEEQLNEFVNTEEESELVRQQEQTLLSEITLLRSKLANCETELLQCKNKIRLVMEELTFEQLNLNRETDERINIERKVINEFECLQNDVEQAKRLNDHTNQSADNLKQEVNNLETTIIEKKLQVERLVADMKEANLQSLTVACQDEQIKHLLEGAQKPGSTRKMIGSPRQLETAVPTSKNPHGVWV